MRLLYILLTVIERIKTSDENGFKQFIGSNQKVKHNKVIEYLLKLFAAKKLSLTRADIWQPLGNQSAKSISKFNIYVYIEDEASIDGYFRGLTKFGKAIYNLFFNFRTDDFCDNLNLNHNQTDCSIEINNLEKKFREAKSALTQIDDLIHNFKTDCAISSKHTKNSAKSTNRHSDCENRKTRRAMINPRTVFVKISHLFEGESHLLVTELRHLEKP